MGLAILVLLALALSRVLFYLLLVPQVEGDGPVHLLERQRWVMRANSFWRLPTLELPDDVRQRHTASDQIKASVPKFSKLFHGRARLQFILTGEGELPVIRSRQLG